MAVILRLAFLLVTAHFLADFALQSDTMAREKSPASDTQLQKAVPWYWWLSAHASIHGLAVFLVTSSLALACCEILVHFLVDLGKCRRLYGMWADQALHLSAKAAYVIVLSLFL